MSKSTNMLRTRRKDNNVKPNRRLDRKSSRGMLFENEELRLKTININAEVERGQSDIKKLKRENDQLRREIWYLRDEYDKLDKLLREKECQHSSSSSYTSESESCSSCTEESEAVETSQNIENFQKTNMKKLTDAFDILSVVPEENSAENSDKNSNRMSPNDSQQNQVENHVIQADQSYPTTTMPKHFFSPIKSSSKTNDDYVNNQFLGPESPYMEPSFVPNDNIYCENLNRTNFVPTSESYPGFLLPPLNKTTSDLIVKTDNQNFHNSITTHSTFSNGGNLEELLKDIETISHDILKMSNSQQNSTGNETPIESPPSFCSPFPNYIPDNFQPQTIDSTMYEPINKPQYITGISTSRPYKSELNVILMPTPMQLIGVEKYRNINKKSTESLNFSSHENISPFNHTVKGLPLSDSRNNLLLTPVSFYDSSPHTPIATTPIPQSDTFQPFVPVPPFCPGPAENQPYFDQFQQQKTSNEHSNPFYFGSLRQISDSSDYFNANYRPDNVTLKNQSKEDHSNKLQLIQKDQEVYNSKTNLLDTTASSEHVSSENEETGKLKQEKEKSGQHSQFQDQQECFSKSPKLNIRRKVSIHFKGKKPKQETAASKKDDDSKSPLPEKKQHPLFDIKFSNDSKRTSRQKNTTDNATESSATQEQPPKTPGTPPSKSDFNKTANESSSASDHKSSSIPDNNIKRQQTIGHVSDSKTHDRSRKSSSASPERRHGVHAKESGSSNVKKCHKKHKKLDKSGKIRRSSVSIDRFGRERSYSICTDRSNMLDHRLGGLHGTYDDFTTSDRERTNSLSSCDTVKDRRKLSAIQNFPQTGKIPWCGCWGNGCV